MSCIYIHNSDLTDVWLPPCELHFKTPFATRQSNMNLNYYVSLHLLLHNCTVFSLAPSESRSRFIFHRKNYAISRNKNIQFKKCKLFYSFLLVWSFALACRANLTAFSGKMKHNMAQQPSIHLLHCPNAVIGCCLSPTNFFPSPILRREIAFREGIYYSIKIIFMQFSRHVFFVADIAHNHRGDSSTKFISFFLCWLL